MALMSFSQIKKIAILGLIIIFSLTIVFHLLIIAEIIPFTIVWGGRLSSASQMYIFESVSILINAIFLSVVLCKAGVLKIGLSGKVLNIALWTMTAIFLLNTIGNLLSTNSTERMIFTPVTILLSLFSLIVVLKEE